MEKRADALLFLPAMLLLAIALFVAGWLVIKAGGWLVRSYYALLGFLPHPAALSLAVILTAFTVGIVAERLLAYRRKPRLKA